jgi:hypothetical protein
MKPMIRYYNGYYLNGYDLLYKNTVKNLDRILNARSNYSETDNILTKSIEYKA